MGFNSEKEGFEPSRQITPPNTLAGCRLQPLGHFSNHAFIILTQLYSNKQEANIYNIAFTIFVTLENIVYQGFRVINA